MDESGKPLTIEFLLVNPDFERVVSPYKTSLERLGIKVSIRVVEPAQYAARVKAFDFDVIIDGIQQSH